MLLSGFVLPYADELLDQVQAVVGVAPWRQMQTPGGRQMGVAMSNCGAVGWISDRHGYRYAATDPRSGQPWPAMPVIFSDLARRAAAQAGFADFEPDCCLLNRYRPGTRLSLHRDQDERDFTAPIVSVSLGIAATFLLGGQQRRDPVLRIPLRHGDVVVWGGPARLRYHGILPLKPDTHPRLGSQRFNLTFRKAL